MQLPAGTLPPRRFWATDHGVRELFEAPHATPLPLVERIMVAFWPTNTKISKTITKDTGNKMLSYLCWLAVGQKYQVL